MARSFNGTTDYITAHSAASFSENSAYSAAFWTKYNLAVASNRIAFAEARASSNNPFIQIETQATIANKTLLWTIRNDAGTGALTKSTTANVFDGNPHHFLYTQDGSGNIQCYVDGATDVAATVTLAGSTTVDRLAIGVLVTSTTSKFFPGIIWDVAKWSRKLSAGEAKSLGAGLPASHLGPDHYWPLWGVDSPEPDIGNG